jgi:hypothetical protein
MKHRLHNHMHGLRITKYIGFCHILFDLIPLGGKDMVNILQ